MKTCFNFKYYVLAPLVVVLVLFMWFAPTSFFGIDNLTVVQQRTIAIFCYAALMWMFELIPAWATSVTSIVALLLEPLPSSATPPLCGCLN